MNDAISVELHFFLVSVLWGAIILLAYDSFRVLRRLIRHNSIIIAIEDLIFWISASFFIFSMIYRMNNGSIRGFSIIGMCAGMLLYHYILSNAAVKYTTLIIRLLIRPFRQLMRFVGKAFQNVCRTVKKAVNYPLRRLKMHIKSVKISMKKTDKKSVRKANKKADKKSVRKADKN